MHHRRTTLNDFGMLYNTRFNVSSSFLKCKIVIFNETRLSRIRKTSSTHNAFMNMTKNRKQKRKLSNWLPRCCMHTQSTIEVFQENKMHLAHMQISLQSTTRKDFLISFIEYRFIHRIKSAFTQQRMHHGCERAYIRASGGVCVGCRGTETCGHQGMFLHI